MNGGIGREDERKKQSNGRNVASPVGEMEKKSMANRQMTDL